MASVKEAQQKAITVISPYSDTASMDVDILLGHCVQQSRTWMMTWPDVALTDEQQQKLDAAIARRAEGEPIAYIVGAQEFWSLPLKVNSSTLIPRPETELLVEIALEKTTSENAKVLDLGTGSGAISLAIKSERPLWKITAVDFSHDALAVAKGNAEALQLDVQFIQSDWFSNLPEKGFDLIISNPPYIDQADVHLSQGDIRYEPDSALIADDQGFGDIKRISAEASHYLTQGGFLMFEHGFEQGEGVRKILHENGFSAVETVKDLAGLERVTLGRKMAGENVVKRVVKKVVKKVAR